MKPNWLIYILICSMGLNIGTIASFAYGRYNGNLESGLRHAASPLPFRELTRPLNLRPEQHQCILDLLPKHQQRIDELRQGLGQRRQELFAMLRAGDPSLSAMHDKIGEIGDLQSELEVGMVQLVLEFRNCLEPEQRITFMKFMEHRLMATPDGKGRGHGSWGHRGR